MALIRTAEQISLVSGNWSGAIAARDRSGLHLRGPHRRIHRSSIPQLNHTNAYRTCLKYREQYITPQIAQRWTLYANRIHKTNRVADKIRLTWWNAFLHINLIRVYNGLPILSLPPTD